MIDVLDDFEAEARNGVQPFRRREHAHASHAEIAQDLRADAIGTQVRGNVDLHVGVRSALERGEQCARILACTQNHHHPTAFRRHELQSAAQRPAESFPAHADDVAERVEQMHAHERRHRGIDAAAHEREVEVAMHVIS